MEPVLLLYKPLGTTPLELITNYVREHPLYKDVKLGYAGRLDPMAEGLLVVLVGDENKRREQYLGLEKEYEIEILLGVATDTHDVLGLIVEDSCLLSSRKCEVEGKESIEEVVRGLPGTFAQEYPAYSSKAVQGKPLYWWAREGRLNEITLPVATRTIHSSELTGQRFVDRVDLIAEIWLKLATIQSGDFRKDAIIKAWESFERASQQNPFTILQLRVTCSSGTYMRSLAHELGKRLGLPALAFSIKRTRVGSYSLSDIKTELHADQV